jgi:NAD-dependent dihydropyrimidine dehydrogenase PreA subunit
LASLWTPRVVADWSGCEPSCSNCGRVCPTGAIRALALEEKRVARMGLAVVNHQTCLPYAKREACQLCVDECQRAGYHAIEFMRVGTELDVFGQPVEESGCLAPVVLAEQCVGCGLCQMRCFKINVHERHALAESAIEIQAGEGKEDRLMHGSYLALRQAEQRQRDEQRSQRQQQDRAGDSYLPDFLSSPPK